MGDALVVSLVPHTAVCVLGKSRTPPNQSRALPTPSPIQQRPPRRPERRRCAMDPEAVRRTLETTASPADISGSTRYDCFVISGVRLDAAEHGRVLCSFVVTPRLANPQGYLISGVTATLADQLGSAVFYSSGVGLSGVSLEISVSYVDTATIGEEIEVEATLLRAGKSIGAISVDFRKKRTGKLIAQARHTKYLAVSSKL
uniref:Uncharacterized protein n=1 Tax=Avena sativa TaxID=4498 RepID=A0ACD5UWT3_AVESA